jgi:hypothetical protein
LVGWTKTKGKGKTKGKTNVKGSGQECPLYWNAWRVAGFTESWELTADR